jgi:import inner membrane translocase subunit TIM21
VKSDSRCIELLGRPASKIKAYGEPTSNKWARARPIAHTVEVDKFGTMHFRMHFYVEGTEAKGVVYVHMTKAKDEKELVYDVLSLNVPGEPILHLENRAGEASVKGKVGKMFGVQWR